MKKNIKSVLERLFNKETRVYRYTFLAQIFIVVLGFSTVKLASYLYSEEVFGLYNVIRRAISILTFPLLLGLGISVPRFLAIERSNTNTETRIVYFLSALVLLLGLVAVFLLSDFVFSDFWASLFFPDKKYYFLFSAAVLCVIGLCFHTLIYSYFRGVFEMNTANLVNLINLGILPLLAVVIFENNLYRTFLALGIGWLLSSLLLCTKILHPSPLRFFNKNNLFIKMKELFAFGLPRVPGEFALFGLFALPVFLAANLYSLSYAGYVSLALAVFQLFVSFFDFLNIIILPKAGEKAAVKDWIGIKKYVNNLILLSIGFNLLFCLGGYFMIDSLIRIFFGVNYMESASIAKTLLPGLIPYVIYVVLRNVIDVFSVFAYNSIHLTIALIILTGLILVKLPAVTIGWSISISLLYLGTATYLTYYNILSTKLTESKNE